MTRLRKVSPVAAQALAVIVGAALTLAGVYMLLGLHAAFILGGVALVALGLLVDI